MNIPALADLTDLVRFPTVSTDSNVDCTTWIRERLEGLGFETEWLSYVDQNGVTKACVGGCLRPKSVSTAATAGLAYFCHNDVVPVESWSFPHSGPWEAHVRDDKVYGRGSCDMKGSLACFLAAVEANDAELTAPVYVFCTADEEIGFLGAQKLVTESELFREVADADLPTIIGEPTELQVVHAHKGGCMLKFTATGRAAHSSTTEGINANFLMIPFLHELQELVSTLEADPANQDDRFDPPGITLNLILNDHTPAVNITPAQSIAKVYFRTLPDMDVDAVRSQLTALAGKHSIASEPIGEGHPLYTDPDCEFVRQVLNRTGSNKSQTVSYGTDGGCFNELNRMIVFGPGNIQQAHTDDEFIAVDQLRKGVETFGQMIRMCCSDED